MFFDFDALLEALPFQDDGIALYGLAILVVVVVLGLLRRARRPRFEARALLNKSELRLYGHLRRIVPREWHVLVQTSYGAMLRNPSRGRYMSMVAKRADFVIADAAFAPVAVIEYQGTGHYGSTRKSRQNAERRDAQKRQALREAGLPLIEVPARFDHGSVAAMLEDVLREGPAPRPNRAAARGRAGA